MFIVNAFTDRPYAGNPAAVMLVREFPEDSVCQKIAAEMQQPTTAFVKHLDENKFHIRWFSPAVEIALCGHATLASTHVLYREKISTEDEITFESVNGKILSVLCSSPGNYTLDFPLPTSPERKLDVYNFISIFGKKIIAAVEIEDDFIIELPDEESVREYAPNEADLVKLGREGKIVITTKGTKSYDFVSRCFAPKLGILEDPVTGSTHYRLAHYWRGRLNKSQFTAYQASSRGGEIDIKIVGDRARLSGKAVLILSGHWHV